MPNRLVRDQIIITAVNMAQVAGIEHHDLPNGVVQQDAFCIAWLQDILDFWYHIMPFSATVREASLTCTANSDVLVTPSDFILDVRNGLTVQTIPGDENSYKRALRLPLQKFINYKVSNQQTGSVNYPTLYCLVGDDNNINTQYQTIRITPTPSIATKCILWYYQLPTPLQANQKPKFPDDYACVEYLRLRILEWAGVNNPGTAQKFCTDIVAKYRAAGLLNESEDDEVPLDTLKYRQHNASNTYSWMGNV